MANLSDTWTLRCKALSEPLSPRATLYVRRPGRDYQVCLLKIMCECVEHHILNALRNNEKTMEVPCASRTSHDGRKKHVQIDNGKC